MTTEIDLETKADRRELWLNQIWQGLNFGSKAVFLALMTPWMLQVWGETKFGVFAMASSLVVSLNLLDFGVRSLTRIRLVEAGASGDPTTVARVMAPGLFAFGLMGLGIFLLALGVTFPGWTEQLFTVEREDAWSLVLTTGLTALYMVTLLLMEPLCAQGSLSKVKAANTIGAVVAIPAVALVLWAGGGVSAALIAYFAALFGPNFFLIGRIKLHRADWGGILRGMDWSQIGQTFKEGGWYYATTVALIAKTHFLTLIVGVVLGPAEAGLFYIALRLTELLSGVAGTSSEPAIAALADRKTVEGKRRVFTQAWDFGLVLTLHGFLLLGICGERMLDLWLGSKWIEVPWIGWGMALFGLGAVFSRMVVNGSMGLGLVRWGAVGSIIEAVVVVSVVGVLLTTWGIGYGFGFGILGVVPLLPVAWAMAQKVGGQPVRLWLGGMAVSAPWLLGSAVLLLWAVKLPLPGLLAVGAVTGGLVFGNLRQLGRGFEKRSALSPIKPV